jgi:hypothetical protein
MTVTDPIPGAGAGGDTRCACPRSSPDREETPDGRHRGPAGPHRAGGQIVTTTLPRAWPCPQYRRASGAWSSG